MEQKKLWNHQINAIKMAQTVPNLALFMDMGTGKSRTIVEILRRRFAEKGRVMRTLILCPPIVVPNWKNEIKMFSKIQDHDVVLLRGPGKKRYKHFCDAADDQGSLCRPKIVITNYEACQMAELWQAIKLWNPEILVCDESHVLKSPESKRAKAIQALADKCDYKYILTGTPILNNEMDLFQQFRILDNGLTFGKNFYGFRNRYFQDSNGAWSGKEGHFPKWVARRETHKELNELIYKKAIRVTKSECMDLPPLLKQNVYVELGKDQARMYKEMKHHYVAWTKSVEVEIQDPTRRAVVAQLAVTKALRLQQIVSGFAKTDDGQITRLENPRANALRELLESITKTEKVIVWAVFKENYNIIAEVCKDLKIKYTELHGDCTAKQKEENMQSFRSDPEVRVIIANQAAGGVGVNLIEASYAIYYSKNFSLKDDLQSEARNYRGGSEMHSKVTRIDIIAQDTIDDLISESLAKKQDISYNILDRGFLRRLEDE